MEEEIYDNLAKLAKLSWRGKLKLVLYGLAGFAGFLSLVQLIGGLD